MTSVKSSKRIFIKLFALIAMLLITYGIWLLLQAALDRFFMIENTREATSQAATAPALALKGVLLIILGISMGALMRLYANRT